jgi:pyridoxine 5-phosphate synthase
LLKELIDEFKANGIRTSIFLNPDPSMLESAAKTGCDRIELYTEGFATAFHNNAHQAIAPYIETALKAHELNLGINAGHDLDLHNLHFFASHIHNLLEVSIGHALICDALEYGMSNTVKLYLNALKVQ